MSDWPVDQITDHADAALARLVSQYGEAVQLQDILRVKADRTQELEDVQWALLTERDLDNSVGEQLDGLGEIVGEPRLGRNDADYREAILTRIQLNRAGGEPESIITFLISLTGGTFVLFKEIYPAKVEVFVNAVLTETEAQRVRSLIPAAVGAVFVSSVDGDGFFGVDGLGTETPALGVEGVGELGIHTLELNDGSLLELNDGSLFGVTDRTDPILPTDGGRIAELFEV